MKFEKITYIGIEYYKRNCKNNKKGDFKKHCFTKDKTQLTNCLNFLIKYPNSEQFIINQLTDSSLSGSKKEFYENLKTKIDKFGFERLSSLAQLKRSVVINKYSKPVEFKSLTFRGRTRLTTNIISYNKNFNSIINNFINISWLERGSKLSIPVKYSKTYHGRLNRYHKNTDTEYRIKFLKNKKISIILCTDGQRFIPDNKTNFCGVDVNVKHNLFCLSDGTNFDYNRKLVNDLAKELVKIDELKKDKTYNVGKQRQNKVDTLKNKIKKANEELCSNVCKYLISNGFDHIVMENLDNSFGKSFVDDKNNFDINFNRIVSALNLSSLKDIMKHVSMKYGISVSLVHPAYTSKNCPICGCIDDGNRPNQETFCCVECGHKDNADHNSAINILNRVLLTVLKQKLLKLNKIDDGTFEPKKLKVSEVKDALLSLRPNIYNNVEILHIQQV
jgi:putative transposase